MKKLVTVIISFFVLFIIVHAGKDSFNKHLSFQLFKKWMASSKVESFKFISAEKRGWTGTNDLAYHATFVKKNIFTLYVQLSKAEDFETYKEFGDGYNVEGPFELNGREAVFIESESLNTSSCFLKVRINEINACASLMINITGEKAKKEILTSVFKEFNFDEKLKILAE